MKYSILNRCLLHIIFLDLWRNNWEGRHRWLRWWCDSLLLLLLLLWWWLGILLNLLGSLIEKILLEFDFMVVQDGVRELLSESVIIEELSDSLCDYGLLQNLVDRDSLAHVDN